MTPLRPPLHFFAKIIDARQTHWLSHTHTHNCWSHREMRSKLNGQRQHPTVRAIVIIAVVIRLALHRRPYDISFCGNGTTITGCICCLSNGYMQCTHVIRIDGCILEKGLSWNANDAEPNTSKHRFGLSFQLSIFAYISIYNMRYIVLSMSVRVCCACVWTYWNACYAATTDGCVLRWPLYNCVLLNCTHSDGEIGIYTRSPCQRSIILDLHKN